MSALPPVTGALITRMGAGGAAAAGAEPAGAAPAGRPQRHLARVLLTRVLPLALAIAAIALPAAALATPGGLRQLTGTDGCVSASGSSGVGGDPCAEGRALDGPAGVVVSPDGANVYAIARTDSAVAAFSRSQSGALTQLPGADGCAGSTFIQSCADAPGMTSPTGVAISPDGKSVYVVGRPSSTSGVLTVLDRDAASGRLAQKAGGDGCLTTFLSADCTKIAPPMYWPIGVAVSPDGKNVYVTSLSTSSVTAFARASDGTLTPLTGTDACVSQAGGSCQQGHGLSGARSVVVSPDGKSVYVTAQTSDAVVVLSRDAATGKLSQPPGAAGCISRTTAEGCTAGRGFDAATAIAVSPGGAHVYVTSNNDGAIVTLDRDAGGGLTQPAGEASCLSSVGLANCREDDNVATPVAIDISPDGANAYVAELNAANVSEYAIAPDTGLLSPLPSPQTCVSFDVTFTPSCTQGRALRFPEGVVVAPDGRSVYGLDEDQLANVSAITVFAREMAADPGSGDPGSGSGGSGSGGSGSGGSGGSGSGSGDPGSPPPTDPPAAACAHALTGTPRADILAGTALGDSISGRAGNDVLRGLAGADCLSGGRGDDRLIGGPGRDRISGGPGADTISARDGRRDTVDCGPGRDRVRADRADRLRNCERVSR